MGSLPLVEFVNPLLGALVGAVTAYIAIRSDLASLKARMDMAERSTIRAHERIDNLRD